MESLLKGRDVFSVLPTAYGKKSLIHVFQLFVLAKNRASNSPNAFSRSPTIIVICPIKSIMEEQITSNEFQYKMRLTSLHDSYGSWHLYVCRSLFVLSTFLLLHSCLHGFRCYWHVPLQSLTPVICHVFMHCLGSFVMQDMSPRNWFRGKKIWNLPWTCCLLASYIVTPGPVVWLLKLHASTVCSFLS